ncbi:MAG: hypothetical protein GXP49_11210 [Deltaproteobacteria bacterium]|nr:hypothetical protein [Deltaproteobacteria bacterium]
MNKKHEFPYTEDTLVQHVTVEHIEKQIGWESVYAYNQEALRPSPQGI